MESQSESIRSSGYPLYPRCRLKLAGAKTGQIEYEQLVGNLARYKNPAVKGANDIQIADSRNNGKQRRRVTHNWIAVRHWLNPGLTRRADN